MNFDGISCCFDFHFYDTFSCFFTNCYADWKSNQITIAEFDTSAFISVIHQDFVAFIHQSFFDPIGQSKACFILDIDWNQMHIKWRQFFREVNPPSVTVFPFWSLIDKEACMLLHNS